jgi:PST family polysaccharide transporter
MKQSWDTYLPSFAKRRLEGRHDLKKIIANITWLFFDKILRMGVGLVVIVWVARYLGPAQFGTLSYAMAFVAFFSALGNLGLESVVIRNIVVDPGRREEILATAFVLRLIGGGAAMLLALSAIMLIRPTDNTTQLLVGITAAGAVFQALDTIDYWFQAEVRSKYTVYAKNAAFLTVSVAKALLILWGAPLVAFAWAGLAEIILGAMGLLLIFKLRGHSLKSAKASREQAIRLLRQSWPLLLSGVFVLVLLRIDQIMLGEMRGDKDVGLFSAALRISEVWYFIPMAIVSSVLPYITNAKKHDEALYYRTLNRLYLLMIWLSLAVAVPVTIFSQQIVMSVYGQPYIDASTVIAIHCWAGIFIFFGSVSNLWYLLENLNHYTMYRCALGAVVNICLNVVLIPKYGINGAAIATLITQIVASYLFDALSKKTRVVFRMKTACLLLFLPTTYSFITRSYSRKEK